MITPAFDLRQDPDHLTICIRAPYTRTSEFDLFIDGTDFKFYAKPYFLRLSLPGRVLEDGREKATFDIDKGVFTLKVPKETPGEHFEGLQMLTSLLAPKGSRSAKPLVEDVSGGSEISGDGEEEEEEFDWQLEQEVYTDRSEEEQRTLQKYGFGNQRSGVFSRLQEELSDVIDVKNPDGTSASERRQARLEAEALAFSSDHYLADLFEDDEINRLLKFTPWWSKLSPSTEQEEESDVSFSDEEKEQLRKFTNRSYLLDKTSRYQAWLSLVDILLAYSYEVRSTEGEHSVESPWTVRKLSGTLCWLETYSCLLDVLVSFGRRVLCYPLYRHFALVTSAISDTVKIFQSGKACILKCLLEIHKVFRENDPAYILNDLYITDYCIWIQRVKSKKVMELATVLQNASLQKKDLELELDELESAARMVVEEEQQASSDSSSSASSDSSSSDSSSGSEESETEGQGCFEFKQGGGGREACKDNPSQPSSFTSPIPHTSSSVLFPSENRKADAPRSASQGCQQLIQELEEQMTEELRISADSSSEAETRYSLMSEAAADAEEPSGRSSSSGGTLLEPNPCTNPLLIVQTHQDRDFIS
ncbi:protein SHQ1 homolog isoform X2 [Girardinichthys multiradiatus]|uniref:protein SHQ1 homolog isoform X2 n=1 Tax=Girardinichthys multiradiatus TaxID=208333 RepID=UPI001FACDB3B|nr:protein SHQ1 homolog isoform X2 [Girardinichthys multiradiatus]